MSLTEHGGLWVLRRFARVGTLHLTLPQGRVVTVGQGQPEADLEIVDYSVLPALLRRGLTGFAEGYMDQQLQTSELRSLLAWGGANQRSWFDHPAARWTVPIRKFWQRIIPEWRHPRVRSMNDHYNLGNSFYEAWLDETMTYSSARFEAPDQSLADAQRNKYKSIADAAGLQPGMTILEIGCGWGGFAEYAASHRDCNVVAITLSDEQGDYARKRMAEAGVSNRVDIRVQDFRDVEGQYDAVVSIEMIESVDETHWAPLFDTMSQRLRPGGRSAMQIITIKDDEWERYRSRADFIQQYIFPGGQIPAPKVISALAGRTHLDVEKVETFGLDYARTLMIWHERFDAAWPSLKTEHGLNDRFRRMWDLYLMLCEVGFRMGRISVEQWVFMRPAASAK